MCGTASKSRLNIYRFNLMHTMHLLPSIIYKITLTISESVRRKIFASFIIMYNKYSTLKIGNPVFLLCQIEMGDICRKLHEIIASCWVAHFIKELWHSQVDIQQIARKNMQWKSPNVPIKNVQMHQFPLSALHSPSFCTTNRWKATVSSDIWSNCIVI